MQKVVAVVTDDGVIHRDDGGIYKTAEEIKREQEAKENKKKYLEEQHQRKMLQNDFNNIFGGFYFVNYKKLLDIINDDTALGFRYLYLCTFAGKDGKLEYKGKVVLHKDFRRILQLSKNLTNDTVNELTKLGLLYEHEDEYYVSLSYYIRNQKLPDDFKCNSSRIIDKGIQELYEQSTSRKHTMLGKIIPLLEYINRYNNILCTKETIVEFDHKKVQPLSGYEICRICGRSDRNSDYFIKELKSFVIDGRPFVRRIVDDTKYNLECYIINPYVVYMGSRNDQLEWTFKLFDLNCKRKRKNKLEKGE